MKRIFLHLAVAGLLITGCDSTVMPVLTAALLLPTSAIPVPAAILTFTVTAVPTATATPELPISPTASAYLEAALEIET